MHQLSFHPYAATVVFFICLVAALKFNNYLLHLQEDQEAALMPKKRPVPIPQPTHQAVLIALGVFLVLIFALTLYGIYMHGRNTGVLEVAN